MLYLAVWEMAIYERSANKCFVSLSGHVGITILDFLVSDEIVNYNIIKKKKTGKIPRGISVGLF